MRISYQVPPLESFAGVGVVLDEEDLKPMSVAVPSVLVLARFGERKWRRVESNHGPRDYETLALTN